MRRLLLSIALTLLTLPVQAQDMLADYSAAYSAFILPGSMALEPDTTLAAIEAILPLLQGDWVRGDRLSGDTSELNADRVADACGGMFERLVQTSPHGFDLQHIRGTGDVTLHVRHDYMGLNRFQRSFDEAEWLAFIGLDPDRPGIGGFYHTQPRGEVFLFVPNANVMVLLDSRGVTEIYVRCPQK